MWKLDGSHHGWARGTTLDVTSTCYQRLLALLSNDRKHKLHNPFPPLPTPPLVNLQVTTQGSMTPTFGAMDTTLAVYTGAALINLVLQATNDDCTCPPPRKSV